MPHSLFRQREFGIYAYMMCNTEEKRCILKNKLKKLSFLKDQICVFTQKPAHNYVEETQKYYIEYGYFQNRKFYMSPSHVKESVSKLEAASYYNCHYFR